ncbi:MAG: DUF5666 domain-containing protein, partial [Candidatus Limnocylindria bacterium]
MKRLLLVATSSASLAVLAFAATVSLAETPPPSASPAPSPAPLSGAVKPGEAEHPELHGTVTSVSSGRIVIARKAGTSTTVLVTATTAYTADAPGTTTTTLTSAAVQVGSPIEAEGKANADGTYTATTIEVHQPRFDGTVGSVNGSTIGITRADGTSAIVELGSRTAFHGEDGVSASATDVAVGMEIHAQGTLNANGSLSATTVEVKHPELHGTVTSVSSGRIVIARKAGTSTTVLVTATTAYTADAP